MTAAESRLAEALITTTEALITTTLTDVLTALRDCQRARRTLTDEGVGGHRQALRDLDTACVTLVALVRTLEVKDA